MIETLISLFLLWAAPAAAPPLRVRDNAASLPDTGAVAAPSDSLLRGAGAGARPLRLAGGSYGSGEGQGSLGGRRGAWSMLAHGGWQGSDGDFRYLDDNATPLEPGDDVMVRRQNARFDAASALV